MAPIRIQRTRRRLATTPAGAIYVGRPTLWGNPFRSDRFGHARSVLMHADWLQGRMTIGDMESAGFGGDEILALLRRRQRVHRHLHRLTGRNLQCWCPPASQWCHADTLLALANAKRAAAA